MEEKKIPERFLPVGSVVLLEGGDQPIMITGYLIFKKNLKEGEERKMFDYGACYYPEGIVDYNSSIAFNHDKVKKVLHLGYVNDAQKDFSKLLNEKYEDVSKLLKEAK